MKVEKVTLIGLGAMGVFFAPQLKSLLGDNFRVLANGERLERLKNNGVTVNGENLTFNYITSQKKDDPADLIIIAVKDMQIQQALDDIKHQVGDKTNIMCVMNGVDSENKVAEIYGKDKVLYSFMRVSINMANGVADFDPTWGKVHFGEDCNIELSERVLAIKDLFENANIGYNIDEDMIKGMWFKFACNVGENLTCAMLGVPFGAFHISPSANIIREAAMDEVLAIAQAKGVNLSKADFSGQAETLKKIRFENRPSTLQDLDKKSKTEVEMFAGRVIDMGKSLNIVTPVSWMLYNGIRVHEEFQKFTV